MHENGRNAEDDDNLQDEGGDGPTGEGLPVKKPAGSCGGPSEGACVEKGHLSPWNSPLEDVEPHLIREVEPRGDIPSAGQTRRSDEFTGEAHTDPL